MAKQLSGDEFRLYELIWKRTVASQMADAKGSTATIRLGAVAVGGRRPRRRILGLRHRHHLPRLPRRLRRRQGRKPRRRRVRGSTPAAERGQGRRPHGRRTSSPSGHETSPPPRYTEASLTAELEKKGIGRPSTYASTISTIQDRGYVRKQGSALVPSWIAFSVIRLLEQHFHDYVDYEFTADMEGDLDKIANGQAAGPAWLKHFYFGEDADPGLLSIVNNLGEIDAREINSIPITDGITLRVGKFGPYLESSVATVDPKTGEVVESARANVPEDLAPDELTAAKAIELMETAAPEERVLGADPHTGHTVVAKNGRYGAYVTEIIPEMTEEQLANQPVEYYKNGKPKPPKKPVKAKPRTGSLFASMTVDTVTLDEALQLMSLPARAGPGRRRQPHHGAERPLRPVPEEGHGLPLHRLRRGNLHHHAGAGAGDLLAAQAARRPCRRAAAGRVRPGPGLGEEHRGEGRPLRPVHHRRHHQHHRSRAPPPWRSSPGNRPWNSSPRSGPRARSSAPPRPARRRPRRRPPPRSRATLAEFAGSVRIRRRCRRIRSVPANSRLRPAAANVVE